MTEYEIVGAVDSTEEGAILAWEGAARAAGHEPAGAPSIEFGDRNGQPVMIIRGPVEDA